MTCIVAIADKGRVIMGGDSAGVDESYDIEPRADEKVFRVGDFVLGFTDSFRMGQLLRYSLTAPKPPKSPERLDRYMSTSFVDAVRECLKKGGYAQKDKEVETGGTFLVGVHGRLYKVEEDYQVGRMRDAYSAVGSGRPYALGSLHSTSDEKDGRRRVLKALAAAAHHNAGVRAPFLVVSSE